MKVTSHASRQLRSKSQILDLNGVWSFTPVDAPTDSIAVPALWESEGFLNLDGEALYRREIDLTPEEITGFATLRFEAVMDTAEVKVNGHLCGVNNNPFTPFEIECGSHLHAGTNVIEVKVVDHHRSSMEHIRSAHGKQGWANGEFPSPPSVYMTLGGIYRDVSLHIHDSIVIRNLTSDSNPENLVIGIEIENLDTHKQEVLIEFSLFGDLIKKVVSASPQGISTAYVEVPSGDQLKWSPNFPNLHSLDAKVLVEGTIKDLASLKFGLRSLKEQEGKILINDEEIFIRAALVQGFYPDTIYGEPSDKLIRDEIIKAKSLGLNTLRLHIKAFDSRYLEACDELGMLLHCDIPIAEPISHDELGSDSEVGLNCAAAIVAQVRRDYSHPSIFLWSVMNELGLEKIEIRKQAGYKEFVISMYETLHSMDKTRPIIENDWIDPDPDYVFRSQILTSHWYGRLDSRYLASLKERTQRWGKDKRFFYISEFGDWGLPNMPSSDDSEFWSYHDYYAKSVKNLPWVQSQQKLIDGTQKYMGVSDKLQIEIFRATDGVNGFCVTELTDIPWELNGLMDYRRNIKKGVMRDFKIANQEIFPILEFDYAGATSEEKLTLQLHVHNSSSTSMPVQVSVQFKSGEPIFFDLNLSAHSVVHKAQLSVISQLPRGVDELMVTLSSDGLEIASNVYEVPIYPESSQSSLKAVNFISDFGIDIFKKLGISNDPTSKKYIVGENALTSEVGDQISELLQGGASVLVLAQDIEKSRFLPVSVEAIASTTEWGGTDFHFTSEDSKIFSPSTILTIEDLNIRPDVIFSNAGQAAWPAITHAGVFKPMPRPRTGYIVGEMSVGKGRLITCQYRLNQSCDLASTRDIALSILTLLEN
jgi:hypothetical protein